jgi:hypothetical protein
LQLSVARAARWHGSSESRLRKQSIEGIESRVTLAVLLSIVFVLGHSKFEKKCAFINLPPDGGQRNVTLIFIFDVAILLIQATW